MKISLVAAVAKNNVIGSHNALPWYIPEDLKRFSQITSGKTVVMGKNTFDSIINRLGKPLPNRKNVVLSRRHDLSLPHDIIVLHHINAVLSLNVDELFIIGGGEPFKQTIDLADKLYITHVDQEVDGDVLFPEIKNRDWNKVSEEPRNGFSFAIYERTG